MLGKLWCMSSTFPITILNGTFFFHETRLSVNMLTIRLSKTNFINIIIFQLIINFSIFFISIGNSLGTITVLLLLLHTDTSSQLYSMLSLPSFIPCSTSLSHYPFTATYDPNSNPSQFTGNSLMPFANTLSFTSHSTPFK